MSSMMDEENEYVEQEVEAPPLCKAAMSGDLAQVKFLLEIGESVDVATSDGETPLYIASKFTTNLDMVKLLLSRGADVDLATTREGFTPLFVASYNGNMEVVKLLLERGACVDVANVRGVTPLYVAAGYGYLQVVKSLLASNASVDLSSRAGVTPLYAASQYGRLEVVKLLLESGAQVDLADGKGVTPLFVASENGHVEVVKLLLDRGACVDVANTLCFTPLYAAAFNGHLQVVAFLLDTVASIELAWKNAPFNPLFFSAKTHLFDILKLLLDKGAIFDRLSSKLAFTRSVMAGRLDVAELLVHTRPQIATEDPTVLYLVAKSLHIGSHELMELLLQRGANVNGIATNGGVQHTALHLAVLNKQASKVWQLTLHGADTAIPFVEASGTKSVWQLCDGHKPTHEALLHFWSPQTHKLHSQQVKDAIFCALLVAKRQGWPIDELVRNQIMSHVAYAWYN